MSFNETKFSSKVFQYTVVHLPQTSQKNVCPKKLRNPIRSVSHLSNPYSSVIEILFQVFHSCFEITPSDILKKMGVISKARPSELSTAGCV